MKGTSILILEENPKIASEISAFLYRSGYMVKVSSSASAAMEAIKLQMPDVIVVDISTPGLDGSAFIRWVRERSYTPILLLAEKHPVKGSIAGLELEADGYITKPVNLQDLLNRIREALRKAVNATEPIPNPPLVFQTLRIDPSTRLVYQGDKEIILTAKEFDLLWLLASNPGQVFTRDQLLERIWGQSEYIDPGTVTVHIRRLREKIEIDPAKPIHIQTIWGVGYKFETE